MLPPRSSPLERLALAAAFGLVALACLAPAATAGSCDQWFHGPLQVGGGETTSGILSMTNFQGRLVAGGVFSQSEFGVTMTNIVGWDGRSFTAFGSGMNDQINALESFRYPGPLGAAELVAGGYFTVAGGVAANRIARWTETFFGTPAWEPMGAGMDGAVLAIERYNGATYAGGNFWASGGTALANIGRWNETTDTWENIVGSNGVVYALEEYNGYLYAGGSFTAIGGVTTGGFARYDGSSWSSVLGFFAGAVYELEVYQGVLVIGGDYPGIPGSPDLAYFDGTGYGTLGTGGTNGAVTALHANGTKLYVGGTFSTLGGVAATRIGYYEDGFWHGVSGGTNNVVYALGAIAGEEQIGGVFTMAGSVATPSWARHSVTGLSWFAEQPFSQNLASGSTATFTARTTTEIPASLRWYRKGVPAQNGPTGTGSTLSGATAEQLMLTNITTADAGLYRCDATNLCGTTSSWDATLTVDGVTATEAATVTADALGGLVPNPTTGSSRIGFALARDARVDLEVHDVAGRRVRAVDLGLLPAGRHSQVWDGRTADGTLAESGLYFVTLRAAGRPLGVRRLSLVR